MYFFGQITLSNNIITVLEPHFSEEVGNEYKYITEEIFIQKKLLQSDS
jgi:hypothetical protein